MALAGFGKEAERFRELDNAALREAQCPGCHAKDFRLQALESEIARLRVARDTALDALDQQREATRCAMAGETC